MEMPSRDLHPTQLKLANSARLLVRIHVSTSITSHGLAERKGGVAYNVI